jgi:hypothetical protein
MADELENNWIESVLAYSRYFPGICLEELRELRRISG